ncbi:SWR1-complex protein 4 [Moelleriella libera RCEF 2490]|uniref:SWR1-complex protein 4 n=1 Tax=Moelleriella libera RCEF 2490 TaxID=1081109 RepID=A0A166V3X9_9HYPO|nr:SWR1-complex protein 4 [Moelleriella libera RCEF 2490]
MTSSDVRDVLNLGDGSGPRPSKKQKTSTPRPNVKGLAREVLNLGGGNPIAIVPQISHFKKRRLASRKPAARWELRSFKNSGRDDQSLVLQHWRRKDSKDPSAPSIQEADARVAAQQEIVHGDGSIRTEDATSKPIEEIEDSLFAKFNVKIQVPQYTDNQYEVLLQNDDWTREETDYLMGMASDFDLRWAIIWDRYEWTPSATNGETNADGDESKAVVPASKLRSMEDLKARYYDIAAKMMVAQKPIQLMTQQEYALHELMAHFSPKQEKLRKEFAMNTLSRSKEEAREEESLLLEIKRILARSERFNEERRELYNRLDYPRSETDINPFKTSAGLQTLLQNLMNADKSKKRKSIMGTDGANTPGAGVAGSAAAASGPGQNASGALDSAKRDNTASSNAATRESTVATSTPTAAGKKGQQQEKLQPPERRKLDSQEEGALGVSHFDRLGSGPTYRTEKVNKLFSHKSNQQQLRINNTLNELDTPGKVAMPGTSATTEYERLLSAITSLLDAKKVSDKMEAEVKIEQAKKAEKERHYQVAPIEQATQSQTQARIEQASKSADDESVQTNGDKSQDVTNTLSSGQAENNKSTEGSSVIKIDSDNDNDNDNDEDKGADKNKPNVPSATSQGDDDKGNGNGADTTTAVSAGDAQAVGSGSSSSSSGNANKTPNEIQQEGEKSSRPGSSGGGGGAHKRSASVMSAVSDKSNKRQKR